MRDEKITCDSCGADLTTRSNSMDYRLVLGSESKPGHGAGAYTNMMIYPPINRTHHFCDLGCLDHWRDRAHYHEKLWQEWNEKWKAEHGTKDNSGRIFSYPCLPDDVRLACNAEFEAAALAAFPANRKQ